jgi:membrane-associated PAP2 superfamily phosphatase
MATSATGLERKLSWDAAHADGHSPGAVEQDFVHSCGTIVSRTDLLLYVFLPILVLVGLTALIRCFDLDVRASQLFFDASAGKKFPALHSGMCMIAYHWGPLPGLLLGIGAAAMFVASFVWTSCRPFRDRCAFLALVLALGPGLIVNGLLKPNWNRPRPCDVTEFGGSANFVQVLVPGVEGELVHHSFPSGHASMGFYLLAPAFLFSRSQWRWSTTFLLLGLSFGLAIGISRIAQGRHFPSDVLWSGAIVYFTGLGVAYILPLAKEMLLARNSAEPILTAEPVILRIDSYRDSSDNERDTSKVPSRKAA